MPYLRRLPRIPPTGRVTVRLTIEQRNLLLAAAVPLALGHTLARAAVRKGKLALTLKRDGLDRLILAAAAAQAPGRAADRELGRLLAYLESLADRFEEPSDRSELRTEEEADAPVSPATSPGLNLEAHDSDEIG